MFSNLKKEMQRFKRQVVLSNNKYRGKLAEDNFALERSIQGYEIKRTGKGHDFVERNVDWLTGQKGPKTYVEVKSSSSAPLSELQKKTKKKKRNYRVERRGWF